MNLAWVGTARQPNQVTAMPRSCSILMLSCCLKGDIGYLQRSLKGDVDDRLRGKGTALHKTLVYKQVPCIHCNDRSLEYKQAPCIYCNDRSHLCINKYLKYIQVLCTHCNNSNNSNKIILKYYFTATKQ